MQISEDENRHIRHAYYMERKSQRQIAREGGRSREAIKRAVEGEGTTPRRRGRQRDVQVYEPYRERVEALLRENEHLPRKQRYTASKITELIREEGYEGCESRVRQEVGKWRKKVSSKDVYLPLSFEPGEDAQCDWGEALVTLNGQAVTVQVFVMRLCYSRKLFVMAFPSARRECFFFAHVQAFAYFGGVPHRIMYDNVPTAVHIFSELVDGTRESRREETRSFVAFRSYYLFDAHFCHAREPHEKGGVENGVGYSQRTMFVPIPRIKSYEELNHHLRKRCDREEERTVRGETQRIGQAWEKEKRLLRPLPAREYDCAEIVEVRVTPYSQVTYETNRYSIPAKRGRESAVLHVYPFFIEVVEGTRMLARHVRSYEHGQDLFDPQHYLPLLKQRPGAFEYALPLKKWKKQWPPCYHVFLERSQEKWPEGRGVREFLQVLELHQQYSAKVVETAVKQALDYGAVDADGVLHCIYQMLGRQQNQEIGDKSTAREKQEKVGQPLDLGVYDGLLQSRW